MMAPVSCDDPWNGVDCRSVSVDQRSFDDDFKPSQDDEGSSKEVQFEEMPDREEYLAALERKLSKMKIGKKNDRAEAKKMVEELRGLKEDRWGSAMKDVLPIDVYDDLSNDPCAAPFLMKYFFPEKNYITPSEIQKLLDNDCLTSLVDSDGDPVDLTNSTKKPEDVLTKLNQ